MDNEVQERTRTCDIVPGIAEDFPVSTSKFANAGYVTFFDGEEVNIFDVSHTKTTMTKEAILRGWQDTTCGLLRIPLVKTVINENTDTVLVKEPPTELLPQHLNINKAVHNVYELKS